MPEFRRVSKTQARLMPPDRIGVKFTCAEGAPVLVAIPVDHILGIAKQIMTTPPGDEGKPYRPEPAGFAVSIETERGVLALHMRSGSALEQVQFLTPADARVLIDALQQGIAMLGGTSQSKH